MLKIMKKRGKTVGANYCKLLSAIAFAVLIALAVTNQSSIASSCGPKVEPALFEQLEAFHGHVCAGSIFGARLGLAAKEALKAAGGTGKFTAIYYDHSCPVDGIQVGAGTTYGNKALKVYDRDEHRLVLKAEGNKRSVEARLTKKAEEKGLASRDLAKKIKELPADAPERVELERKVEEIQAWLKNAPDDEVLTIATLKKGK